MYGFYLWRCWQSWLCTRVVFLMVEIDHWGLFILPCLPEISGSYDGVVVWKMINEPNKRYMCDT